MPIGKNAIKRVENNGYSKVKTSAPDMENSHVIAAPSKEVMDKLVAPVEKKTAVKKATAKPAVKKPSAKKVTMKQVENDGFKKFSFGQDLPYYLL